VNFDIGHLYAWGQDVPKAIRTLAPKIRGVDIEDIRASDIGRFSPETGLPLHDHEVPGDGDMPLADIIRTLRENWYDGFYTVELYNKSHIAEEVTDLSIERLRPIFAEVERGA
jgi:sugar phosphate isomerase/epimerase